MKKRANVPWLHATIHHGANILSHMVETSVTNPISALVCICAVVLYFFHYKETKIFAQEVALGVAKATLKAIMPPTDVIESR